MQLGRFLPEGAKCSQFKSIHCALGMKRLFIQMNVTDVINNEHTAKMIMIS